MMNLAPIHITFMLAHHCYGDPIEFLGWDHYYSEAGKETREFLRAEGLIGEDNRSTERGRIWIEFICKTPLPVSKWVMPEREAA